MPNLPMKQRLGLGESAPIEKDFPQSARLALAYVLNRMGEKGVLVASDLVAEVLRTGRLSPVSFDSNYLLLPGLIPLLEQMQWDQVFTLCERLYEQHIAETGYWDNEEDYIVTRTKEEALAYFSNELNQILVEENIGYSFVDGLFQKRGRAQTQQAVQRVGTVLGQARLRQARKYFIQARKFFDQRPEPNAPNCVKEALCAFLLRNCHNDTFGAICCQYAT